MYEDDPYFKMYDGIIYNTFIKHPIKYPIAGTVEDVRKIIKKAAQKCSKRIDGINEICYHVSP